MRSARYAGEALLVWLLLAMFRALPLDFASWLGAKLGRLTGRWARDLSRVAHINLSIAFPEKSASAREAILRGMWEHLGRMVAEFAHLRGNRLIARMSFEGLHHLPPPGRPVFFASGHFGQWELTYPAVYEHGVPITVIYRQANNPWVERMIARRRAAHSSHMIPKGVQGAVKMARALKSGESLALLFDQKMNEGIDVNFFGRPAKTAPAVARLALKYGLPIIPAHVVRVGGAHFKGIAYPALDVSGMDEAAILRALHALLERWIAEYPEQWLWIHRRWDKAIYSRAETSISPS